MAASGTEPEIAGGVTSTNRRRRRRRRHPPRREHASTACARTKPIGRRSFGSSSELSERSLYLRFHGHPTVDERLVEPVLDPDWVERGALIGSVVEAGEERVVALANYVRLRDPTTRGGRVHRRRRVSGARHRDAAARAARRAARQRHGIERFVGEVMADNAAMIGVFEGVGFEVSRTLDGGEVEMTFPIAADCGLRARASRNVTTLRSSPRCARSSRRASRRRARRVLPQGTIGGELFRNILAGEFAGAAYPVNRNGESVAGVRGYGSIADIPDPVDLAVVCVPAAQCSRRWSRRSTPAFAPSA